MNDASGSAVGLVSHKRFWGLVVRRESWRLSWRARLIVTVFAVFFLALAVRYASPFLAVTAPVGSEYLVVEGWAPPFAINEAVGVAKAGGYRKVFTTGTTALEEWGVPPGETFAELGAERLRAAGLSNIPVQAVPCRVERKDRTYNSALALKNWCETNHFALKSLDVLTVGPHARRTRLLFEKAFGDNVRIGIIAVESRDYEPARWWVSSEGVRDIVGEAIAYFYARVLFHPAAPASAPAH